MTTLRLLAALLLAGCTGEVVVVPDAGLPLDSGESVLDAGTDAGVDAGLDDPQDDIDRTPPDGGVEPEDCTNGIDDDADGKLDCADAECAGTAPCDVENTAAACGDGLDNDDDGYRDCKDFDCEDLGPCGDEEGAARCADGLDNDNDGYRDCVDFGCRDKAPCGAETTAALCANGRDDDGDGYLDCVDFDCAAHCTARALRVVMWNVQSLETSSGQGFAAVRDILKRLDADVACLEEVEDWEGSRLARLALALGYPYRFQGQARTGMAGGLTNACLSRYPIVEAKSLTSRDISSDPNALEIGRDHVKVRVEVVEGQRYLTAFVAHLKSGFQDADYFRRQIESIRLKQAVEQHAAAHATDAIVVGGDFNEEPDSGALGRRFTSAPQDLASSFRLGSDLGYPFTYQPFTTLISASLTLAAPSHEDRPSNLGTRIPSGRRIDFILYKGLRLRDDLVYDACNDDGVDAPPTGDFLKLAGAPLSCGLSLTASDHRPVVADFDWK